MRANPSGPTVRRYCRNQQEYRVAQANHPDTADDARVIVNVRVTDSPGATVNVNVPTHRAEWGVRVDTHASESD